MALLIVHNIRSPKIILFILIIDKVLTSMKLYRVETMIELTWTRSMRESKENCFPDMSIPRIRRRIARNEGRWVRRKSNILNKIENRSPGLSFASTRSSPKFFMHSSKTSVASYMAAKLPLTIFGDIGELANNKLEPKFSFFSRVSGKWKERRRLCLS